MLKKLFSMKIALILMLLFAASIGIATFIENDYGTQTARALIYNARWFEVLLFYFSATIVYNIFAYKMYRKEKWGQFVLHLSFLLIAIGAFVTRYAGYEGIMHIREKQSSNIIMSDFTKLSIEVYDKNKNYLFERKVLLSSLGFNHINDTIEVNGKKINIKLLQYLPAAKKSLVDSKNGKEYLELVVASKLTPRQDIFLSKGEKKQFQNTTLKFDGNESIKENKILLFSKNGKTYIKSFAPIFVRNMATGETKQYPKNQAIVFKEKRLYQTNGISLVLKDYKKSAKIVYQNQSLKPNDAYSQMLALKLSSGNESKVVHLFGKKGKVGQKQFITLNGMKLALSYGSIPITLPFALKLNDFIIDRYPGSMAPSSYSSKVVVIDKEKKFPYHIYMNHVLDYKGYRFFQSSYDMDERGTILSVNHDPGTLITYIGYILLTIGFLWSYFSKSGRVAYLLKRLNKLQALSQSMAVLIPFAFMPLHAASIDASLLSKEEIAKIQSISKEHSERFARLIVQDSGGRMEPLDTLNLNILRKISYKKEILGLNYNQVLLGILVKPKIYNKLRFIKVGHPLINKKIGLPKNAKYASFKDFFDEKGDYKIQDDLDRARKKRPALRTVYDKELIKVDERLNVLYMSEQGYLLKIFPKPNDPNKTWYNPIDAIKAFPPKESQVVQYLVSSYLKSVLEGINNNKWKHANEVLEIIKNFQKFYGSELIPPQEKVEAEIFYNRIALFEKLILAYILIGLVLLIVAFASIIKPNLQLQMIKKIALGLLIVTFLMHTAGLLLRWYIAGHAPWSNAYESILLIAWTTALAGFAFAKKSPIAFAATSILAGIFLFVAFISSLNPQITNLVPVLKSYWLMIHVAVITSSYGFLGLGALLGIFNLILMIINRNQNKAHLVRAIKELSIINEITLLLGLGFLTVGNFLGGVWANESWGRYWSWDPKETWAAVTILVYAAVVHMRFVPKIYSIYSFNVASVVAYFSVIMTYFGVNYYLSGMHSYAAGDPVPIPVWVYPAVASLFILIALAYKYRLKAKI